MYRKFTALCLAWSLLCLPLAGCSTLDKFLARACEHSQVVLDNLEMAQQRLEVIRAFLAASVPADLQVELDVRGVPFEVTKEDIESALALVDTVLTTIKKLVADACAGDPAQALKAVAALDHNVTVHAASLSAQRHGALKDLKGWRR